MHILVLDTIHGGKSIGEAYVSRGDQVDLVDVYRGEGPVSVATALARTYDLIVAPVHLDPDHPLLKRATAPVITHHEAARQLVGDITPTRMVEITGARGKTTTAHALASLIPGAGILHTSSGTYRFPEKNLISRSSITPASVLAAVKLARDLKGWLIAEESLGITGAGTLGIITSGEDYRFAADKKSAIEAKIASAGHCPHLLLAEKIPTPARNGIVHLEDAASCKGTECTIVLDGTTHRFTNPLLALPAYRDSLMLAATAAVMLGIDPAPLASFTALAGRMATRYDGRTLVVDNANSGTNAGTTIDAAQYARNLSGTGAVTLVIGQQEGDGAVCEGFPHDQMLAAVETIRPVHLVWVGRAPDPGIPGTTGPAPQTTARVETLEEGYTLAKQMTKQGSIVLAVKTWR
ncbi:MAG: coenzyme F430 synthase [Methanoregula sp.]|nr:coenzyme F430 synthase [Methanoregula sp.]